jgi:hypothetical protein
VLGLTTKLVAVAALVGASLAVPNTSSATRCTSDNGSDVKAYFGIQRSDAIWLNLQGLHPPCVTVVQGHTFYRTHGWITQLPPETVYPEGYRPDHPAPMKDFLSKITQARYVVSRDGRVEIARTVGRRELLARAKLGAFGDLFVAPDSTLTPGVTIYGAAPEWTTLEPFSSRGLSVGQHTIEIYWTLTKQHCDGFAADPANDCLPAGESLTTSTLFDVVPHDRGRR